MTALSDGVYSLYVISIDLLYLHVKSDDASSTRYLHYLHNVDVECRRNIKHKLNHLKNS